VTALTFHFIDKDIYEVTLQTSKKIKVTEDHSLIGAYSCKKGLGLKPIEVRNMKESYFILT